MGGSRPFWKCYTHVYLHLTLSHHSSFDKNIERRGGWEGVSPHMYKQWVKLGFPWNWLWRLNPQWKIIKQRTHEGCRQKLFATVELNKGNKRFPKWQIWYSGAKIRILPGIAAAIRSRQYHFLFTLEVLMARGGGVLFGDVYFLYLLVLNQSVEVKDNQTESVYLICVSVCLILDRATVLVHVLPAWVWGWEFVFLVFFSESPPFPGVLRFLGNWGSACDSQRGLTDQTSSWSEK